MHCFKQEKILPYSPEDLFALVLDVESYPDFLPWCTASKMISRARGTLVAELTIQVKGFLEKYQSKITYHQSQNAIYSIDVEAISGPFRYLSNSWKFEKTIEGTTLTFNISFAMKSMLLDKLLGLFLSKAAERIIVAFERRAAILYQNTAPSQKIKAYRDVNSL